MIQINPSEANREAALRERRQQVVDCLLRRGPDHPETVEARVRLAVCRGETDPGIAAAALQRLFDEVVRLPGRERGTSQTEELRHTVAQWRERAVTSWAR